MDPPNSPFVKRLLLDLRDAVKFWKGSCLEAEHRLDVAGMQNQRLQSELEAAVKFNEDRRAMFVEARAQANNLATELQNAVGSRLQLEARIGRLERVRNVLCGALFVVIGVLVACWMAWIM